MGVFAGIRFPCRAGPMCPAAGYAFFGGARGPRPTGRYVEPRVGGEVGIAPYEIAGGRAGRDGERWGKMFTLAALTLGNYYCIIN